MTKLLFPASFGLAFILIVIQAYLLIYFTQLLLKRLKLLKKPYGGMDYAESIPASVILLGVLVISSSDVQGIFQAAKSYNDVGEQFVLFFARCFMIIILFSLLFVILNYLNLRFLFQGYWQEPALTVSIFLSAISVGMMTICSFMCKEIIDNMTPKFIDLP